MTRPVVMRTDLPYPRRQGKVRDIYEVGDHLLLVASDRVSAYDVVLPNGIPDKGATLTQISNHWFSRMQDLVDNHLVATRFADMPKELQEHREQLVNRSVLVERVEPLKVECVVRGYLIGSGWRDYQKTGQVCGIPLPDGLEQAQQLPEPLFTPATKAEAGAHDENISFDAACAIEGRETMEQARELSLSIYRRGLEEARKSGILLADTKFEFGRRDDGTLILIDECLTPDSSRFWPMDEYRVGSSPPSFDKQYVRDYLDTLDWDKTPPGPELPTKVVEGTMKRYRQAFWQLTGKELDDVLE